MNVKADDVFILVYWPQVKFCKHVALTIVEFTYTLKRCKGFIDEQIIIC